MFHFSADRLAGLDNMVLKITAPPTKVSTLVPNRVPLADRRNLVYTPSDLFPMPPDVLSFRPLPPLPSASTLQLPSFLELSPSSIDQSPLPRRSAVSLPSSALSRVSPCPLSSPPHGPTRRTEIREPFEGPQWIPAFHHPNSPYVPWSSPVRRRILPPASPFPPSPHSLSSPHIRSGAVAPEPWASSTFSQAHKSGAGGLSGSWKSLRNSIKRGLKSAISRLGRSTGSLRMLCTGRGMLRAYHDTDIAFVHSDPVRATSATEHSRGSRDSLASSDSKTLVAWLAERRGAGSCPTDNTPMEMSLEEYELVGSWLDLRHRDGGWLCGVQDCDVHTAGGSPCPTNEYLNVTANSRGSAWPFPLGPFSAPPRFYSLPRLPCHSFNMRPCAEEATMRCMTRCRELSMPGGWTFS